jgi:hypothetical protein
MDISISPVTSCMNQYNTDERQQHLIHAPSPILPVVTSTDTSSQDLVLDVWSLCGLNLDITINEQKKKKPLTDWLFWK